MTTSISQQLNKLLPVISISVITLLTACTGGNDGDSVGLASGNEASDPVAIALPIAYIKKPLPEDLNEAYDLRDPNSYFPGAELFVRNASSDNDIAVHQQLLTIVADELNVSVSDLTIDIKDLETSHNGETLVFAARIVPEPLDNNLETTSWNLWQYDFATQQARYVIGDRLQRNEGVINGSAQDTAPFFLNDEILIFTSTRQVSGQAKQLNEGRAEIYSALNEDRQVPATVLHRLDVSNGGVNLTQLSFNPNHDIDPIVTSSGEIIYSRYSNNSGHYSFYQINPTGVEMSALYGQHSQDSGTTPSTVSFSQPRELEDGRLGAILRPAQSFTLGGQLIAIDSENFVDSNQPTWASIGLSGVGQNPIIDTNVRTDNLRSEGGQYTAFYPLNDGSGRLLVSWSPCRVIDDQNTYIPCSLDTNNNFDTLAPPLYGGWILDPADLTQQPLIRAEENFYISELVAGDSKPYPGIANTLNPINTDLASNEEGQLIIDSVYDLDGIDSSPAGIANHSTPGNTAFNTRPARYLRFIKPVPLPNDEVFDIPNFAFGVGANFMREILGYSLIEPDGSVNTNVPANTPFSFELVNALGQRISARHNHWLQVAPGEVLHCTGCHNDSTGNSHGRLDDLVPSSNPGAQPRTDGSLGFENTLADLFGLSLGETMATVFNLRRPIGQEAEIARPLALHPNYTDDWTDSAITPLEPSTDLTYDIINWELDLNWLTVQAPIIVPNLDPELPSRIVINYEDHIQKIWTRTRAPVNDAMGNPIDTCFGCHNTADNTAVPPGQLDLSPLPSDMIADRMRSYQELLANDNEQWIDDGGQLTDRTRLCESLDENGDPILDSAGDPIILTETLIQPRVMNPNNALSSTAFFNCFTGAGDCGRDNDPEPPLRAECVEGPGTPAVSTINTVDHTNMLSDSELRLISEWLDIGAQYYNNPFDTRLSN